ncbi:MAG: NAD(P)-binding domain-containing protein [Candidatus Altiarchaeia archaeon]
MNPEHKTVCVMGLGYVGLPLAEAFAKHIKVIGYDIDEKRLKKLKENASTIKYTSDPSHIKQADYVIICVPTPCA